MLSHLVGRSNRADICRLRQLEQDLTERDGRIAEQEARILALMEQRDEIGVQNRELAAAQAAARAVGASTATPDSDAIRTLELRLVRERAHTEALEEKLATLMQASTRLSAELEAETARRRAAESELATVETLLGEDPAEANGERQLATDALALRTFLYVGGRPRQVANLRRFVEAHQGNLLSHDGGIEDSPGLLAGLVSRSDHVFFPVECISHEAVSLVKRFCEAAGKPFQPLRSASLASFMQVVLPASDGTLNN